MQIAFPPEIEAFVQRQLQSGKYSDPEEVILAGLELLKQQDEIYKERLLELQKDILIGLEDSKHGRVVDGPTAMAQIKATLFKT